MSISSISAASSAALYQQSSKGNVPLSATPATTAVPPAAQVQQAGQAAQTGQRQESDETQHHHHHHGASGSSAQSPGITQSGASATGTVLNALV